jgi:hypothetical protein
MTSRPDSRAASAARPAASAESDLGSLTPEPHAEQAPAVPEAEAAEPALDAHGFDPQEYRWVPVTRKPRKDGWTPQRQQDFIAALAETGCVEQAALTVRMSERSCYRLRRSPGAEGFSAAWDVALQHAARRLLDVAFERAFRGTTEPVFDRDGHKVGTRYRQNDRLLMFLLRAYMPERFRHAHRDGYAAGEALPPSALDAAPMADVLRRLEPVMPPEPHRLMPPGELEDALFIADTSPPGELPHWHRGKGDAEPVAPLPPAVEADFDWTRYRDDDAA